MWGWLSQTGLSGSDGAVIDKLCLKFFFNLRRTGGVWTPTSGFSQISQKTAVPAPPFLVRLFTQLFRTLCENFRPRSLKVKSPGHVSDLTSEKVWMLIISTLNYWSLWYLQRLASVTVSIKCLSQKFDITDPMSGQLADLSIAYMWINGRKMKCAYFGRNPFKTLSNIGLQVDLIPWVGILRPLAPCPVANVVSGRERSPAVSRQ